MRERFLVSKIMKAVKQKYPRAYVLKLADRYTRFLPDLLILTNTVDHGGAVILFVETKVDNNRPSPGQLEERIKIDEAHGRWIVARDVDTVLGELEFMGAM